MDGNSEKEYMRRCCLVTQSCLTLCGPPRTAACQAPLSMSFSRGSSQNRDQTCVSYIVGGLFTTEPESTCQAGQLVWIPGFGRSTEEGNGNPLQYSCLVNPMDRGAWWVIVHRIAKESGTTERL